MPQYTLICTKKTCKHEFDEICSFSDYDDKFSKVKCPECGKKKPKLSEKLNRIHFIGSTDKMNNFTYAAQTNFNNAIEESTAAKEEARKRGITSPYADLPDFTDNGNRMNFVD